MTLERYLQDLVQGEGTPSHAELVQLSGLNQAELGLFRDVWSEIPVERRRTLMDRMVSVGEDNVELDYYTIFKHCLVDDDPNVRARAVSGLWECDDRNLVTPLINLLKDDPDEQVRASAAVVLGKFGTLVQDGKLLLKDGERIKDVLLHVLDLQEESAEVRRRALEAAACFDTNRISELIRWAYSSEEPKLRVSALYAMGRTGNPVWLSNLIKETESSDPAMRYEAATACAEMGEEDAVPHLVPLLRDDDTQVQVAAVQALGVIGGPLAKRAIMRCLKSDDDALEEAAEAALEHMDTEEDPTGFKFRA